MRHFFILSVFALAVLLGACGDNATTPVTTIGEIYGTASLIDEYTMAMSDNSEITVQLLEDSNVVQTVKTLANGSFSFKNVQAGVYGFRLFKHGYTWNTSDYRNLVDTASTYSVQFVGRGKYDLGSYWRATFVSTNIPDSTYWAIKPDIRYEVIKDIQAIKELWIKDTMIRKYNKDSSTWDLEMISIYGRGTREKRKIRCMVDFEKPIPSTKIFRTVTINNYVMTMDGNVLTGIYEYSSPNYIIRDSTGTIMYSKGGRPGSTSNIELKEITIQATSVIPNSLKQYYQPNRIAKTKELKLSLTD